MDIQTRWPEIKKFYDQSIARIKFASISTVDKEGNPNVTPIGSLILRENATGFFFDRFPRQMRGNLEANSRVAVMVVDTGIFSWFMALRRGRFTKPPGIRLYGKAGSLRKATEEEADIWQGKIRRAKGTKGYDLLWKDMSHVRDIRFDGFRLVKAGAMTRGLWD